MKTDGHLEGKIWKIIKEGAELYIPWTGDKQISRIIKESQSSIKDKIILGYAFYTMKYALYGLWGVTAYSLIRSL